MLRFSDYSISGKLTWMNMLVSSAALGVACTAFIAYDLVSFQKVIDRNLSIQAQIVGTNSTSAILFDDREAAERTLAALQAAPNIMSAGIYSPDGRPFAGYWRDHASQLSQLPFQPTPPSRPRRELAGLGAQPDELCPRDVRRRASFFQPVGKHKAGGNLGRVLEDRLQKSVSVRMGRHDTAPGRRCAPGSSLTRREIEVTTA